MYDYLIISDIHLGDKDCKSEDLLKVLKKYKKNYGGDGVSW
jgi:UDP-2,3-diacylglucosamine pyrophosphatase LpxH